MAKEILSDVDTLAAARRCYPSDEVHDAALVNCVAQALAAYRKYLLEDVFGCAQYHTWMGNDGCSDVLDIVEMKNQGVG